MVNNGLFYFWCAKFIEKRENYKKQQILFAIYSKW